MPIVQHQLPTKAYYLDRLGNMSSSSSISSGSSSTSMSTSPPLGIVGGCPGGRNKQILSLKPKQPNCYVQHLDHKPKDPPSSTSSSSSSMLSPCANGAAPVTMLALKKKEKTEKNVVTQLTYRKPSSLLSGSTSSTTSFGDHSHLMTLLNGNHQAARRPGSPSSSGYETDSLLDQENCDVFSSLLHSTFGYIHHPMMHHHHHDMLHSHPIWSPQPSTPSNSSSTSSAYFMENEKNINNKFLVQ